MTNLGVTRSSNTAVVEKLIHKIITQHNFAISAAKKAVEHAIKAGEFLLEAKKTVGHGNWETWVEHHCKFSARTASGYMRLANSGLPNQQRVADMSLRVALTTIRDKSTKIEKAAKLRPAHGEGAEFDALVTDIAKHGLRKPITVVANPIGKERSDKSGFTPENSAIDQVKIMPRGYWRNHKKFQPQFLNLMIEGWDEADIITRANFLAILNYREELMPAIDQSVKQGKKERG